MHPALKLNLNGFKLRNDSLFRSNPPYGEGSALVALPTVVGEAQEREGLSRVLSGCNSKPNFACLWRIDTVTSETIGSAKRAATKKANTG
jgi:hypothetical protein